MGPFSEGQYVSIKHSLVGMFLFGRTLLTGMVQYMVHPLERVHPRAQFQYKDCLFFPSLGILTVKIRVMK